MTRMYKSNNPSWSRRAVIGAVTIVAIISTGCTTNYLTNSTQGTYGVPMTERTIPQRLLDRSIEHTAKINTYALEQNLQQNSRMSIDSFYSEVLLSGEVPTEAIKTQVEQVISSMPDVRRVYNELNVSAARGYSATVQDAYITSKIMAKAVARNNINSSQIKTVTNNGVVYVMGRMTPTQQSLLIDVANDTAGVTELVLLTTLVNDNGVAISDEDIMFERDLNTTPSATAANATGFPDTAPAVAPTPTIRSSAAKQGSSSPYVGLYKDQQ